MNSYGLFYIILGQIQNLIEYRPQQILRVHNVTKSIGKKRAKS